MNDDQFTPQEQALIERLQKAPQRRLRPGHVDIIQERMLAAVDAPVPMRRPHPSVRTLAPALVAVAALILGVLLVNDWRTPPPQTATAQALAQHETAETAGAMIAATATPIPAETGIVTLFPTTTFAQTRSALPTGINETPGQTMPITTATGISPTARPSMLEGSATPTPGIIIVVEGPVRTIQDNIVTIYGFKIQLQPDDPMLTILNVGDMARVTGNPDKNGTLMAVSISNSVGTATGAGSALINGRVQAINGNGLTVNGIHAQLPPNDPRLKTIQVGSFVSVNGNFERQGAVVVLVVVNIILVKDADVQTYLDCLKHKGMGMGNDAMGMAAPPAMGMGDDAMGMGEPPPAMGSPGCN